MAGPPTSESSKITENKETRELLKKISKYFLYLFLVESSFVTLSKGGEK